MTLLIEDLAVRRGDFRVLEGVCACIRPHEILILRGPNGAGKTTLLRTLAGLQPAEAGRIAGAGDRVVYAGHADGLKAQMSVAENLSFWAEVFGGGDIDRAMAMFDLAPLADRLAQHLSAGQKRRLGLARLAVCDRPVWLLDEPTVSLDAENVARFAAMVEAHCADGGLAVIATHVDLGLPGARTLDVASFRADVALAGNPFLEAM